MVTSAAPSSDLSDWKTVQRPARIPLEGKYTRLEPIDTDRRADDLLRSACEPGAESRFRYLFEEPPSGMADLITWLEKSSTSVDPLFFAVVDKLTGKAEGRQAFMRIEPVHGVIEIGNILWGPAIERSRVATEALYLAVSHAFDGLGYRRIEWKCHSLNEPSRRAAQRFGFAFEGFRHHMVTKGKNRDTAWFAMIDSDWPRLRAGYEARLRPENFDDAGQQRSKLSFQTSAL